MTAFDEELIAALAEGRLDPEEAAAAEARIAADPAAQAELHAQRIALAALASAPPPALDDLERQRIRRAVAAELDLMLATEPARRRRWSFNWAGIATAAAVLLGVVLAAPLLSLLNTSDDDAGTAERAAAPTTAAALESFSLDSAEDEAADTTAPVSDVAAAAVPTTTTAAEAAEPAAEGASDTTQSRILLAIVPEPLPDLGRLDELRQALPEPLDTGTLRDDAGVPWAAAPCGDRFGEDFEGPGGFDPETNPLTVLGTGVVDGIPVVVYVIADESGAAMIVARALDGCDPVAADLMQ